MCGSERALSSFGVFSHLCRRSRDIVHMFVSAILLPRFSRFVPLGPDEPVTTPVSYVEIVNNEVRVFSFPVPLQLFRE